MPVDPEEGLVTDLMLGMMVVFGADIIAIVGFMWATSRLSTLVSATTTGLIIGFFAVWIGWRWTKIRQIESTDRSPIEELKYQYAAGEISEAEFERKLDRLVEIDDTVDADEIDVEDVDLAVDR